MSLTYLESWGCNMKKPKDVKIGKVSVKGSLANLKKPDFIKFFKDTPQLVRTGVSPEDAWALMKGRNYAVPQDVKDISHFVLRHRLILNYKARAEGITSDKIIDEILDLVGV